MAKKATMVGAVTDLEPLARLSRDLKKAASTLTLGEVRYLVDYYYTIQNDRIRAGHQAQKMMEGDKPHDLVAWLSQNTELLEGQIKRALDAYTDSMPMGRWAKSIHGIGPILAAGLMAHIDITKAPTVGHIWRFAGLDPTVRWEKKAKRPWNAQLKTLCWKIGESFVKVSGNEKALYGQLYKERKEIEQTKNDAGEFATQAADYLTRFKIGKDTDAYAAYSVGKLPPAHVHARAKRWAVKLFLSHWHHVAYVSHYKTDPPKPYILTKEGGHAHFIPPPTFDE
jgi:hypothetical protein